MPTETEREFTARGKEGRKFPWGKDEAAPEHANYDQSQINRPTAVGTYSLGTTPEGISDLAGNVCYRRKDTCFFGNSSILFRMISESRKSESLFELAKILGQQNDFPEIVRLISSTATALFNAEVASIMMINPSTQETLKTIFKGGKEIAAAPYQYVQNVVVGWAMKHGRAFLSTNLQTDARFDTEAFAGEAVRAAMCVPFVSQSRAIGYLLVLSESSVTAFDETSLQLLENLAAIGTPFLSNVQRIQEYFNAPLPEVALRGQFEPLGLIGKSKSFIELLRAVEAASRCDVRVLLEGQSGTGKERVARAIHALSGRKKFPFVAIDCGAIPEHLIESELFGHARGAFTGANYERKGLIVEAHQGTLFMDEMANLPVEMQAKLLRVLQEGEVRPVGSNKSRSVDVRIIAAASVSLRKLVEQKSFREDLFYRLHVFPIYLPTLNERREDIPLLANHFLKRFAGEQKKQTASFQTALLNFMQQRQWPGNIRELENFVERLVTLAAPEMAGLNQKILPAEFQKEFKKTAPAAPVSPPRQSLQESVNALEAQLIQQALIENDWNQSQAARALGVSEYTIRYKMEKLEITKPEGV